MEFSRSILEGVEIKLCRNSPHAYKPHVHNKLSLGYIVESTFKPFPKNIPISKVFRELGLADELGSGMRNTYKYTKLYSGGIPQFSEGDIFTTIIPLNATATYKVGPVKNDHVSDQVGDQVSNQVENHDIQNKIFEYCSVARTKKESSGHVGYKNLTYFTRNYIIPLLDSGKLLYTILEKPQSRFQKYIADIEKK